MSFLDNFISIKQKENVVTVPVDSPVSQLSSTPTPPISTPSIIMNGGVVDPSFLEHFKKVLDDHNLPGADYYEFRKAFDDSAEFANTITEVDRMKMVFKTLTSSGLTKQILIDSISSYKKFLSDDADNFAKALDGKKQTEVGGRQKQVQQLTAANQSKNDQIVQLQKEIQDNIVTINQLGNEITTQQSQLDAKQQNFTVTYNAFTGQLDSDLQKITQNL